VNEVRKVSINAEGNRVFPDVVINFRLDGKKMIVDSKVSLA